MENGEDREVGEERSDQEVSSDKPKLRKWVNVKIKLSDNHYLAYFNHEGHARVFHNIQQLLTAIEVETAKLGPGPTLT